MRFGRSLATVGAAALVAAGALASPAAADDGASGFGFDDSYTGRYAPGQAVTVSGVGCGAVGDHHSSVAWSLTTKDGAAIPDANGAVEANTDGTWRTTIDIPGIVAKNGLSDPSVLGLSAVCLDYNSQETGKTQAPLVLDSTDVDGTAQIISKDTDGDGKYDTQSFNVDLTGFTPEETVTFSLADENGGAVRDLFGVTVDAQGRIVYQGPVPTDLPDGKYRINASGSLYGEGFTGKLIQVTNGWWEVEEDGNIPSDPNPAPTTDPGAAADPAAEDPGAAAAPAAPKSGLAKTGTSLSVAVVAAGLLAAGGVLLVHRRRA